MDTSGVIQLVSIVILIFLSGFFSSAETALSTDNRVRMRTLEEEGSKRAARVNKVLDNYSKMISTILIGNNIVNLTASSLATTLAMRINLAVGIATGVLTIVVLLCGEIVPKTWAILYSEKLAILQCNLFSDAGAHASHLHCGSAVPRYHEAVTYRSQQKSQHHD